jgi:predicted metal-dependent hydrolase
MEMSPYSSFTARISGNPAASYELSFISSFTSIGRVTREGSINLNVNLLKVPEDIIDYIILHEICLLRIREHSSLLGYDT